MTEDRCDTSPERIDEAVSEMHAHGDGDCIIEEFTDQPKLRFGWRCSCETEWVFRLIPFRHYGIGSKWKEEMWTTENRKQLIHRAHGALVFHNERQEI